LALDRLHTCRDLLTALRALENALVESHGGHLWVIANTGGGATFHFTLPTDAMTQSGVRPGRSAQTDCR
jgi:hypothetical protein